MERKQRIRCNVANCRNNDCSCDCCKLSAITVVNNAVSPTAHYCYDYENNVLT